MNASPAAVPSTASTGGGAARAISSPSSSSTAPSAPSVSATSPSLRTSASSSWRLTTVRSASTAMGRAGAALRQKSPVHSSQAARTASSGISSWQRTASCGGSSTAPRVAFAPGATAIVVSPSASTWISATPVGSSLSLQHERHARRAKARERLVG